LSYGDCELRYGHREKLNSLILNNNLSVPAVTLEIRYEKLLLYAPQLVSFVMLYFYPIPHTHTHTHTYVF